MFRPFPAAPENRTRLPAKAPKCWEGGKFPLPNTILEDVRGFPLLRQDSWVTTVSDTVDFQPGHGRTLDRGVSSLGKKLEGLIEMITHRRGVTPQALAQRISDILDRPKAGRLSSRREQVIVELDDAAQNALREPCKKLLECTG